MQIPDYATLRRRAGAAQAQELRRLTLLAVRFVRKLARRYRIDAGKIAPVPHANLRPVPVRNKRWTAPYDLSRDDIY